MAGKTGSLVMGFFALSVLGACGGDDSSGETTDESNSTSGGESSTGPDGGADPASSASDAGFGFDLDPPPTAQLAAQVAGKACSQASDCAGEAAECAEKVGGITSFGLSINDSEAEGGYCTGDCLADADCGEGGACIGALPELYAVGECQSVCSSDSDCRDDYTCLDLSALGELDPGTPKTCLPAPTVHPLADNIAGKACTDDAECGGGFCTRPIWDEAGTYAHCTGNCFESDTCGAGAVCSEGAVATQLITLPGSCEQPCETDADCAHPEHSCQGQEGGPKACRAPLLPPELFEEGGLFDPSLWDPDGGLLDPSVWDPDGGLLDPSLWDLDALFGSDAGVGGSSDADAGA